MLFLAALVWAAPLLVTHTPLLGWILAQATGDLNGSATLRSASLGWFSPVSVSGIEVRDPQGTLVADVPEASGDRSLVKLATNWRQLGTITLERPTIHVVLRGDGSNVEDLIANYLTGPSGKPVGIELKIVDATIHVRDAAGGPAWTIEKLNLSLAASDQEGGPMTLAASGIVPDGAGAGRFEIKLQTGEENQVAMTTSSLPLVRFQSLLARFAPGVQLAGRLDAAIDGDWTGSSAEADGPKMRVEAKVRCADVDLACAQLAGDRLRLATLAAEGRATIDGRKLVLEGARLDSDLGRAAIEGRLELTVDQPAAMVESLLKQSFRVTAEADLARTAAALPGTLHVDPRTTITAGRLKLDLTSQPDGNSAVCSGQFELSDLTATHRGQSLAWQQPVTVALRARRTSGAVIIDRLDCRSPFLSVEGSGSREGLTASAQFDLDQLARQLEGFVDLGGLRLAGKGSGRLVWQHDPQGPFRAEANLGVQNLEVFVPGRPVWRENNVDASLKAAGATDFASATRIDSADVEITAGSERASLRLVEPLATAASKGPWPLAVAAQGDLAQWMVRAQAWNLLTGWNAGGTFRLTGNVVASSSAVELADVQGTVDQLLLTGGGWNVVEPAVRVVLAGQYDLAGRRLALRNAKIECASATVEANELVAALPAEGPLSLSGNLAYRGDVARLQSWITAPGTSPTWRAYGQLQGTGQLRQTGGTTTGQLDAAIERLAVAAADGRQFQEPKARLTLRGAYDAATGQLKLDEMLVATAAAGLRASGQVDQLGRNARANLTGQVGYDWQRLMPLLRPYLGNQINIVGRNDRPFALRGPFDPATTEANASIDWSSMYAYGFQVGPGELDARLAAGTIQCAPLNVTISEGRLTARPRVRLAPSPAVAEVEPGKILDQVRINPDMCAQGLQYIAPILAGVAAAEGRFSIELDQCEIRLDDPAQSKLAGRFTVHAIEVGPGPLVRELAVVLSRASVAKLQRESVIRFHLADGRVYHEGLELVFPEMSVRTHGWVGLDQSMSLVAEMPIPPKWLAGHRLLDAALKNQELKVPIRGTLSQPQIDRRKLDEYNQALVRKATENVIQGELNRQLDKIFKSK